MYFIGMRTATFYAVAQREVTQKLPHQVKKKELIREHFAGSTVDTAESQVSNLTSSIARVLEQYSGVFATPTTLPTT